MEMIFSMTPFERVLLLGTGPTSIQLAVNFKNNLNCEISIAGRESIRSKNVYENIAKQGFLVKANTQNKQHHTLNGECVIDKLYKGYHKIAGNWDTIILSVTTDAYTTVLKQMNQKVLLDAKCVVLISPTFGSNSLIASYLKSISSQAEVISFSTYYGDTRWLNDTPSNEVLTTGMKKKVYIGSTKKKSERMTILKNLFHQLGIQLEMMASPLEAETRNISLYVHPPLFMNEFSLKAIFEETTVKKYVYKLYPEGPITKQLIHNLLNHWKEIMAVVQRLNIKTLNLLQFMVDDNYPLRSESLSRSDIENFEQFEPIHQEYLLYIRYASLLIDPFSTPDVEGRYFDFSAVPIRKMFLNLDGCWDIPRMPKEDYYRVKIIQGIARCLNVDCPMIDQFIQIYEKKIQEVVAASSEVLRSDAFTVRTYSEDIQLICNEIKSNLETTTFTK